MVFKKSLVPSGANIKIKNDGSNLFLKGPVPWSWLQLASNCGAKCLSVGIAAWLLRGIKKSSRIRLSPSIVSGLGVNRYAMYRALIRLEKASLIKVERVRGQSPMITIKDQSGVVEHEEIKGE